MLIEVVLNQVPVSNWFAVKGQLILMPSSSGDTGLAHSKLITPSFQMLTLRAMFHDINLQFT